MLVMGHTRGHILFLLSLLEHGKEVTCILTYMFALTSAEKTNSKGKIIYSITSSGEGNVELKLSFGLLSPVFCFCSEPSFQSFSQTAWCYSKICSFLLVVSPILPVSPLNLMFVPEFPAFDGKKPFHFHSHFRHVFLVLWNAKKIHYCM